MKRNVPQTDVLESLNEEIHTEFALQELEQRLETDPLFVAGLLNDTFSSPICQPPGSYCSGMLMMCDNDARFTPFEIDPDIDIVV